METELRRDREDTGRGMGGGLLVYARQGLQILPSDKYSNSGFNQLCGFSVSTNSGQLEIILIYRPPGSDEENTDKLCDVLRGIPKAAIVIGDYNLPGINWSKGTSDTKGKNVLRTVEEEGLEQLVNFSTHSKGNILDLVITNCAENIIDISDAGRLGKSDHVILLVRMDIGAREKQEGGRVQSWRRANFAKIREEMEEISWGAELESRPMDEAWKWFVGVMEGMVERHVPKRKMKRGRWPEWMTGEIMKLVKIKRRKWRTLKACNTVASLLEYKSAVKTVNNKIRKAKRRMERELATNLDKNNRKFARFIKSKTSGRTGVGPLRSKDGSVINDDQVMAMELNEYFTSVFTREGDSGVPQVTPETEDRMTTVVIRRGDIRRGIRELRKDAAPGPDGIRPILLKETEDQICVPLEILFRKSLREGVVPIEWRTANVTPIYKKGPKGDPGNYRPVSLTSVPGKLLEKIIKEQLMGYLEERELLQRTQHGFVKGRSCTTNRIEFMDRVSKEVDKGKSVDIFYLDFSKAFDKVPHKRLIAKFKAKGVEGEVLTWMERWLGGRKQRVVVNGEKSEWKEVLSGVPQGSVLGPSQFTVFIDDLENDIKKENLEVYIIKFADDTKGMKVIDGEEDRVKLQRALDLLVEWATTWGMEFNAKKCKVMHVGPRNPGYDYFMGGEKLSKTDEETDLGVKITKNLKPSQQCSKAAGRATAVLGQLTRNFHYRDRHVFVKLYTRYVRPHLEFAVPTWAPWLEGDIATLEKVQEKAVKMVTGLKPGTYKDRCKELQLETLAVRRDRQDMLEVYKYLESGADKSESMFTMAGTGNGSTRTRTSADPRNMRVQFARTDQRKFSFGVRVVEKWNALPSEVKHARTVQQFKKLLKRAWEH